MAREHTRVFLQVLDGEGFAEPNPRPMFPNPLRVEPHSLGLRDRIWWGAGTRNTAEWTGEQGMNLMSSTLLTEDTGVPFHQLQAEQIDRFRKAWADGFREGGKARFGKTYAAEPEQMVQQLAQDEAIAAADSVLLTIPNQLGVDYCAHVLDSLLREIAPELGWR